VIGKSNYHDGPLFIYESIPSGDPTGVFTDDDTLCELSSLLAVGDVGLFSDTTEDIN
jgi:hypothetical protein